MKNILGLDLGTNSIGWAVVKSDVNSEGEERLLKIENAGSRIIPMDAAALSDFNKGNTKSQTAERTRLRSIRRLNERHLLRRERLHRILMKIGFLPDHYLSALDRYGHFIEGQEPKLPWTRVEGEGNRFLFQDSFEEMLSEFRREHPDLLADGKKIPYDWTLYFLRKKALTLPVKKQELAWILLNFNQKRGYYQLREEQEVQDKSKLVEYHALKVVSVENTGRKKGNDFWYDVHLENGWVYTRTSGVSLEEWIGKVKEFIVTTDLTEDGSPRKDKEGNIKRSFRVPKEDDWTLLKEKTQNDILQSGKTVGEYIYDALLINPGQKVRGQLVRTIERKFYKEELKLILSVQKNFHEEFRNQKLYQECLEELYPNNEAHRNNLLNKDLSYLLLEDLLFYQRPLKSKKSLIADCPFEYHVTHDSDSGEEVLRPIKCIAKSRPDFQEFRLWQFLSNLKIYKKEVSRDQDVTKNFLPDENSYVDLFDWLSERKQVDQKTFFKYPAFGLKKSEYEEYRWNYVEDKSYPGNETHALLLSFLKKAGISKDFLTKEIEENLWHLLYSISDKQELVKALTRFAQKYSLDKDFVEVFKDIAPFKADYGSYSVKAIRKLLPLMRMGKYWQEESIDPAVLLRIEKILNGESDDSIPEIVRERCASFTSLQEMRGLPLWIASYLVYGRHSEAVNSDRWQNPSDIDLYLSHFRQHSLHNPVVEQVVLESLRTVRDIWKKVGHIDEIHLELGREMKNPADKRQKMLQQSLENENTNQRIKALLTEFLNPEFEIENIRPFSPSQQDLLRIYEEGVIGSVKEVPDDIEEIFKKFREKEEKKRPTRSEVLRYKLWLEQKYRSPYTGEIIPLGKLFTPAYEIEHVIPQSRYFDDSLQNKVICESEVNKLKDNSLGYEFIKKHHGEIVPLSFGKQVRIFNETEYETFVKDYYGKNRGKMKRLMMEELPEDFISRQLNDSRYISRLMMSLLSNIVREEGEEEAVSKHLIVCSGSVTDRLKKEWGVNDVWNKIILPRFRRLDEMQNTAQFTTVTTNGHEVPCVPFELQKGFNKKRIDHRHHAMDAVVIACAGRNLVNYLNNESASRNARISRYDLQRLLCEKVKENDNRGYRWQVKKPWESFNVDLYNVLSQIIVSFKQNLRVINKATNYYTVYGQDGKKHQVAQEYNGNQNWAIRKPMHKDTVFGEINLRKVRSVSFKEAAKNPDRIVIKDFKRKWKELQASGKTIKQIKKYFEDNQEAWNDVNLARIDVYYYTKETNDRYFAVRKSLDSSFDKKKIETSVADSGIRKILLKHLSLKGDDAEVAFSPEGIDEMNENILMLNDGIPHQPILKVRWYEKANKFPVGVSGNKSKKFVEAAKGTNLFFAVYEQEIFNKETGEMEKKRSFDSIPLNVVIERQKRGLPSAPEDENGNKPIFVLSPNDLVYIPERGEDIDDINIKKINPERIYKMVSSSGNQCFFIKQNVANSIVDKYEFSSMNKMEKGITGEMIKEICIPVLSDRLGNLYIKAGQ